MCVALLRHTRTRAHEHNLRSYGHAVQKANVALNVLQLLERKMLS
jgi:hypothetical protein